VVQGLKHYLLVGLKGWIEGRRWFTGDEAGMAEGRFVGEQASARERQAGVAGEERHGGVELYPGFGWGGAGARRRIDGGRGGSPELEGKNGGGCRDRSQPGYL